MDIEVRRLAAERVHDYVRFFDTTEHNHSGDGDKCYCVTFCKDRVYNDGGKYWYPSADERREHGMQRVKDGDIQGYLAYMDGEVVGWCNAGSKADYTEVINHMRSDGIPVPEWQPCESDKIKFIFCFAISPKVQRMGVATRLLEYICKDAASEGFDFVETNTYDGFMRDGFRGTLSMYEKCGFSIYAEHDEKIVVRRALR